MLVKSSMHTALHQHGLSIASSSVPLKATRPTLLLRKQTALCLIVANLDTALFIWWWAILNQRRMSAQGGLRSAPLLFLFQEVD